MDAVNENDRLATEDWSFEAAPATISVPGKVMETSVPLPNSPAVVLAHCATPGLTSTNGPKLTLVAVAGYINMIKIH